MAQTGSGKATVLFVHLDGGNAALQDALRLAATALQRVANGHPVPPPKQLGRASSVKAVDPGPVTEADTEQPELFDEVPSGDAKSRKVKREDLKLVEGLDLNAGSTPLKGWAQAFTPVSNYDKALLAADYLRTHHKIGEVDLKHVYTCFWFADWDEPTSYRDLLNDTRRKAKFFIAGTKRGFYKIDSGGEDRLRDLNVRS